MAVILGTDGDDVLFGIPAVDDTIDGGLGTDTVTYAGAGGASGGVLVDLEGGVAFDNSNGDTDTLISIENATGSAFDDILGGSTGANVLDGGAGADQLFGGDGNDALIGGDGGDQLFGDNGNDNLSGGAGVDVLDGGAGDDALSGGTDDDVLTGSGGADVFDYSFLVTSVGGGGGETHHFTDFFAAHGGKVVNGEVADGTNVLKFALSYAKWLHMLAREEGFGEGGVQDLLGFGELEDFKWKLGSGKKAVTVEQKYFDTWTSDDGGGGEDIITSTDGLDTILDFTSGVDKLDFSDITQQQFEDNFTVTIGASDTVITLDGSSDWQLTLSGVTNQLGPNDIIFAV